MSTFEFIDIGADDPSVIAIKSSGKMQAEPLTALWEKIEALRSDGKKARLYIDFSNFEGFESQIVKDKMTHMRTLWTTVAKCAYVVDAEWIKNLMPLVDAVTPMHLRAFGQDDAEAAKQWLLSDET